MPGPFLVPGHSLHQELINLVQIIGLSNLQALQAATIHGAEVTGQSKYYGTVEAGKIADMLILNSNPLEDIRNTQNIHAVIKSGRIYKPNHRKEIYNDFVKYISDANKTYKPEVSDDHLQRLETITKLLSELLNKAVTKEMIDNAVSSLLIKDTFGSKESTLLNNLGYLLLQTGQIKMAEKVFNHSANTLSADLNLCNSRAEFYFRIDDFSKSKKYYESCLKKNSQKSDLDNRLYENAKFMLEEMKP